MSRAAKALLLMASLLALCAALPALAHARAAYTVSKPKLSAAPVVDVPFTVSGIVASQGDGGVPHRRQDQAVPARRAAAGA